jgi:SAM-dependent methyltransferase
MRFAISPVVAGDAPRNSATIRLRRRARDLRRRAFCYTLALAPERSAQSGPPSIAVRLATKIPFGGALRQAVRHRPGLRRIPVSRLLMGGQAGLDSSGFARALGTLRYGSTPLDRSPHVELLRLAGRTDRRLTDEEVRATAFFEFARRLADTWGDYFGAESDDEIIEMARNFADWSQGLASRDTGNSGSRLGDHVLVAKVPGGSMYQVMDGHHRLAVAIADGATTVEVHRTWLSTETALQHRLWERGEGSRGTGSLSEPMTARELGGWRVARNCQDRLVRIVRLADHDALGATEAPSFLDVGSGYGWYLAELKRLGWRVRGIDRDGFGAEVATALRGLSADDFVVGEWASAAESMHESFDVVSCLGLGEALSASQDEGAAARLLHALDRRTGRFLIADAPSNDLDRTRARAEPFDALVLSSTSFTTVVDLDLIEDPVAPGQPRRSTRLVAFSR